ncbi:MAG: hypothetical protein IJO72_05370 [Oscillospiraceae bacterium]|nr:hypothetical protein [Oscillospiraceae bacterium]
MATYEKVSWYQRLKNDMKDMTFKEKVAHLWEYYKWFAIVTVALIVATVSVVCSVIENSKELAFGGATVNLSVSDEGTAYLKEGWFNALGGDAEKQKIELDMLFVPNLDMPTTDTQSALANVTKLTTMISASQIDYVLADAYSVHYLCSGGSFSPLDQVLPAELLAKFEGKLVELEDNGETCLIAIDISDLPFVKEHIISNDKTYIAFPGNTPRTQETVAFVEYLMNWGNS